MHRTFRWDTGRQKAAALLGLEARPTLEYNVENTQFLDCGRHFLREIKSFLFKNLGAYFCPTVLEWDTAFSVGAAASRKCMAEAARAVLLTFLV